MNQELRKYVLGSVFVHLVIFSFIWMGPGFQFEEKDDYKVTFVQLSKGDGGTNLNANFKNSKSLPTSTLKEQKQALKDQKFDKTGKDLKSNTSTTKKDLRQRTSQKRTADDGGVKLDKTTTKTTSRVSDALARIDQQLKQREVKLESSQAKEGDTGQSPFGSIKGSSIDPALVMYYNIIKRKINNEWVVSKSEFSGTLVTRIVVLIDARGNIIRTAFKKPSGNGSFDDSAMRAIKRSAPFPVPPDSIKQEAVSEGFLIEFNPNSVTGRI